MKQYTDQELRSLILTHYTKPNHFGNIKTDGAIFLKLNSPTCSDRLNLEALIIDDQIKDLKFNGEACAIAVSAADILTDQVLGKSKTEALKILENYDLLIQNSSAVDQELLADLVAFKNIYKQKGRIICATLFSKGLRTVLENKNK